MNTSMEDEGKLDEDGRLMVRWIELTDGQCVEIEDPFHQTWLKPVHALALLSWLESKRAELEKLAKPKRKRRITLKCDYCDSTDSIISFTNRAEQKPDLFLCPDCYESGEGPNLHEVPS
jgi:hypothetical protein